LVCCPQLQQPVNRVGFKDENAIRESTAVVAVHSSTDENATLVVAALSQSVLFDNRSML